MSSAIAIRVSGLQRQQGEVTRLHRAARNRRGFMAALGKRGERELRAHFAKREREPNKSGWPKQHFWARRIRANTVLTEVSANLAVIDIAAPEFRMKLHGGTITPKEAKFLAIPARREAAGKSPRSFGNLRFVPTRRGGLLVANAGFQGPLQRGIKRIGSRQDGIVYYFLVKSVTQRADPHALPPPHSFAAALVSEGHAFLAREARRA